MKTKIAFVGLVMGASILQVNSQGIGDGVILTGGVDTAAGGATYYTQSPVTSPAGVVYAAPCAVPVYTALAGGYYNPNVIYFGGPNSCYRNYYAGCNYPPNVLYFGRGQAYYQGYKFTRHR